MNRDADEPLDSVINLSLYMRPQKVQDIDMLVGFLSVFRSKGYDGASVNELAKAARLKKASLYHRFPGGKKEMVGAVLEHIEDWTFQNFYNILTDKDIKPEERLSKALTNIKGLYDNGKSVCIYRALLMDSSMGLFGDTIKRGVAQWVDSFKEIGMAFKLKEVESKEKAQQTFIDIQGSLVLSKATGSISPFTKTLKNIELRYIN